MNYRNYLQRELNEMAASGLIDHFDVEATVPEGFSKVSISAGGAWIELITDFREVMEVMVAGYFKDVTDYLTGDFKDTVDWYLNIVRRIAAKDYTLIRYTRGRGRVVCRYLEIAPNNGQGPIRIGDFQNHFKLFARRDSVPGGEL